MAYWQMGLGFRCTGIRSMMDWRRIYLHVGDECPYYRSKASTPRFQPLRRLVLVLLVVFPALGMAQTGPGSISAFQFLDLPESARIAALGGTLISMQDGDINQAVHNPALANPNMHQGISFSHGFLPGGADHGQVVYGQTLSRWKINSFFSMAYAKYGDNIRANELGEQEGTFDATEVQFKLGGSRAIAPQYTVGASLGYAHSSLDTYSASALAANLGLHYQDTSRQLQFSIAMKHAGVMLATYTPGNREPLPFNIQLAISKKLDKAPFRFHLAYNYLNRWNLYYDNGEESQNILFGENEEPKDNKALVLVDNFFRHMSAGLEIVGKREVFRVRLGYNHRLRAESRVNGFGGIAGFSGGFGFKISRFQLDYARRPYHLAGAVNQLSFATSIREFTKGS